MRLRDDINTMLLTFERFPKNRDESWDSYFNKLRNTPQEEGEPDDLYKFRSELNPGPEDLVDWDKAYRIDQGGDP